MGRLISADGRPSLKGVLSLLSLFAHAGCATVPPRPDDAPRPPEESGQVDFTALFGRSFRNNTVLVTNREAGLMRRVMVSPNVVFEASRSSLGEPATVGPANPPPTAPDQRDALGTPISIVDSSILFRYLVEQRSQVIAPVVSRVWCAGIGEARCPESTWVERVLMMAHAAPQAATAEAPGAESNRFVLPTALMAVRTLGSSNFELPIVVEDTEAGRFRARLAEYSGEPTACPGLRLAVPYVAFSSEVVSVATGQVIARIDEVRAIATQVSLNRRVRVRGWEPVGNTVRYGETVYTFTSGWAPQSLLCDSIRREYSAIRRETGDAADTSATVVDLVRTTLEPLYRSEGASERPSRRAASAEPPPAPPPPPPAVVPPPAPVDLDPRPRRRRLR